MKRFALAMLPALGVLALLAAVPAFGHSSSTARAANLRADPWIYVGNAGDCGPAAGSNIVTSGWLGGMGLPDNGGQNGVPATAGDPHRGLLLNKNGPTTDCSSAGASIKGVRGMTVGPNFTLGFDYRLGTHCSGGAPRFNVVYDAPGPGGNALSFVGSCTNGAQTPSTQDPQWMTATFVAGAQFPVIPAGSRIRSIDIVFDEGTDTPGVSDPNGVGLANIDNININGQIIRTGNGVAEPHGVRGDKHDKEHGGDDND